MLPDSALLKDDPAYFKKLLRRGGLTYERASEVIGVDARTIGNYARRGKWPYAVQYALEVYAEITERKRFPVKAVISEIR